MDWNGDSEEDKRKYNSKIHRQAHGESRIMRFILGIFVTRTHLACVAGAKRGAGRGGGGGEARKGKTKANKK